MNNRFLENRRRKFLWSLDAEDRFWKRQNELWIMEKQRETTDQQLEVQEQMRKLYEAEIRARAMVDKSRAEVQLPQMVGLSAMVNA